MRNSPNYWENWIFSDGCPLYLYPIPSKKNDRIYTDSYAKVQPSEQVKFSVHSMVWGAMSPSDLSELHIVPQGTSVKADYYIHNILELVLLPLLKRRR